MPNNLPYTHKVSLTNTPVAVKEDLINVQECDNKTYKKVEWSTNKLNVICGIILLTEKHSIDFTRDIGAIHRQVSDTPTGKACVKYKTSVRREVAFKFEKFG